MFNVRLKDNKLLNADIVSPETIYAIFNSNLTEKTKKRITFALRYGSEMLDIYKQHRNDLPIENVTEMLAQMEHVYNKHTTDL